MRWPLVVLLLALQSWVYWRLGTDGYMDEWFHVRQAGEACDATFEGRMMKYNPKLSTGPGLYVLPAIARATLNIPAVCSTTGLRSFNGLVSVALARELGLLLSRFQVPEGNYSALLLWSHPLALFYYLLYYTDTLGLFLIILCWRLAVTDSHKLSALVGVLASLTRQTNILWHGFIAFHSALRNDRIADAVIDLLPHATASVLYLAAFLGNDAKMTIGHAENHSLSAHWAMLLYFTSYSFVLDSRGPITVVQELATSINAALRRPLLSAIACIVIVLAIHFGTLVHPFILADNRHYTFYLFRKVILRYPPFGKYFPLPVYFVASTSMLRRLRPNSPRELIEMVLYWTTTGLVLVTTPLVELRYFVPPFIVGQILLYKRSVAAERKVGALALLWQGALALLLVAVFLEAPFARPADIEEPNHPREGRFMP